MNRYRDHYLQYENFVDRLRREYKAHGKIIIAYDFDDTVNDFHKKGREYKDVISTLKRWRNHAYFIVFSASNEERYEEIRGLCKEKDIPLDAINENIPELNIPNGKKIYYNVFLDDRAGLYWAIKALNEIMNEIEDEGRQCIVVADDSGFKRCKITELFDRYSNVSEHTGGKAFLRVCEHMNKVIAIRAFGATRGSIVVDEKWCIEEIILGKEICTGRAGCLSEEGYEILREELDQFIGCKLVGIK